MLRARLTLARLKRPRIRHFCTNTSKPTTKNNSNGISDKIESNVSKYDEAYRQLDKLDFMTAAKILFNEPPKKKKFGIDFHLVQLFFACMPSLAVYLVAQYARHEMKKMDAELELKKKKEEEEKAKETEIKAIEEKKARFDPEILEVKVRLDKLEEAVKEIAVGSGKQSVDRAINNQEDSIKKKRIVPTESSKSLEKNKLSEQRSMELASSKAKTTEMAPSPDASQQNQKDKTEKGGTSGDTKK
ncbi:hypothetical protein JCGZ_27012 [Jatropha curcas]|uniref:Uncharacterized protein n=1 Tax=Jatropha curcas TaxID=180498 RepID=A0A067LD20_JATCU|nr:uncharacterized protein LOC105630336 [Jatropha curcas]KDP41994.1 hypothetical protein JCGZ_27012 [Jatropha curcas]